MDTKSHVNQVKFNMHLLAYFGKTLDYFDREKFTIFQASIVKTITVKIKL